MNKYIKNNLFVIGIILFLGCGSTLFNNFTYIERRIFGISISIIEVVIVLVLSRKQNMSLKDMELVKPIKPIAWTIGIGVALIPRFLMLALNGNKLATMVPPKVSLAICISQTVYYFVIVAPSEEVIFRGYILADFNKRYNKI